MKIIDNFLDERIHAEIKSTMLGANFAWYLQEYKVGGGTQVESLEDDRIDFQFTHTFYLNFSPQSHSFNLIVPMFQLLKPKALIKVKGNLTTGSYKNMEYHYHTDCGEEIRCKTAVYYVNTTNGPTKFKTGEIVECVENRIVIFDSSIYHTATTCTDSKVRCVINLNYFE